MVFPNSEDPHSEHHSLKLTVISVCDRKSFVREFLKISFFFFPSEKRERNWEISGKEGKEMDTYTGAERGRRGERMNEYFSEGVTAA